MPRRYFDPNTGQEQAGPDGPMGAMGNGLSAQVDVGAIPEPPDAGSVMIPRLPGNPIAGVNTTGRKLPNTTPPRVPRQAPAPTMGLKDRLSIAPAETADWVKETVPKAGKFITDNLTDPEAMAGMAAGMATAGRSTPIGFLASGTAGAIGRTANTIYQEGRAPSPGELGESFLTGGVADVGGRAAALPFRGNVRPKVSGPGQELDKFFAGRAPVGAHQLVEDSPVLNFMGNVAKYGPGGRPIIEGMEQSQHQAVMDTLKSTATDLTPRSQGISIDAATGAFDRAQAGSKYQTDIAGQLKDMRKNSGYPEFLEKYGDSRQTYDKSKTYTLSDGTVLNLENVEDDLFDSLNLTGKKGPPVKALQDTRMKALERGRDAYRAKDPAGQAQATVAAAEAQEGLMKALPDDAARDEYRALADKYNAEINRLDNPAVEHLRQDVKSDDVVDTLLDAKAKTFSERGTYTGQSNVDLLKHIQASATPEAWQQLQGDTLWRAAERGVDAKTGLINFVDLDKVVGNMDATTKSILFGKGAQEINQVLGVLKQAQKYSKDEAGRLFIAIRSGGAAIALGTGIASAMASGHVGAGIAGAAAILTAPKVFAKVLTNPKMRPLLVQAFAKATPSKTRIAAVNALSKWAAQTGVEGMREDAQDDTALGDLSIPPPPMAIDPKEFQP